MSVVAGTRRRGLRALAIGVAAALAGVAAVSGVAWALWSDAFTNPSLQVASGSKVGISFGRVGGTPQYATGPTSVLSQTLSLQDARTMRPTSGLAIPLAVTMRADGNAGLTYGIALPTFRAGSAFAVSTVRLFPITASSDAQAQAACRTDVAPVTQPATTGIVGIAPGPDPTAPLGRKVSYWCLTVVYPGSGGTYTNSATGAATTPSGGTVTANTSWTALVVDPGTYALTHAVTLPGGP